jgi:hypothetical protein
VFNWFVSLPPNSVDTWDHSEQNFHDYFYSGECELRLSHLVAIKQKPNEGVMDYMWRFRDTLNKCYRLTIREKDLAELAFTRLSTGLKDKMEGQDFSDVIQVLQRAMGHESQAREHKAYGRFKEVVTKDKLGVNCVNKDSTSEEDTEVCVAEWVDTPKDRPLVCSFLKPSLGKKDEVKFAFDVTKCDKLFDTLLQNKVICLSENHTMPTLAQFAKGKYCKWHGIFSHTTNECNYFCRRVQLALNDGRLTLGDEHRMKLDTDPFPANVNMINFEEVKVLVHSGQVDSTKGKNVIVSDEPRARMIKPRSPEPGVWKLNQRRWAGPRVKPTSAMLLEKYAHQ